MSRFIIAVDFDGTIVDHVFPDIGDPVPGAFYWLTEFRSAGAFLVLYTMRANERGQKSIELIKGERYFLDEAVEFCRDRGITFDALNRHPEQDQWTSSPKAYAHIYIDDAAFGCPLKENPRMNGRPYVDWEIVGPAVMTQLVEQQVETIVPR